MSIARRRSVGLAGLGLLVGAVGGWLAGLLRAPKPKPVRPPEPDA